VILYYRQDMSVEQIASAVGVSGGTIKTLLFRGRQKLRRALGDLSPGKDL
jgi:DNA-directed RNA polymerase specialized sigma24 family protein